MSIQTIAIAITMANFFIIPIKFRLLSYMLSPNLAMIDRITPRNVTIKAPTAIGIRSFL